MFCSGVITQCDPSELSKPTQEQSHEHLVFLGSSFRGPQLRWSTFEQDMLLGHPTVSAFTGHRKLLFLFAPLALEAALGRRIVSKVQRKALSLSRFHYCIEHIPGEENVFSDMLAMCEMLYRPAYQFVTANQSNYGIS